MTGSEDNFPLLWDDYQGNVNRTFLELREDSDFCDVTLTCEDNQQISAHRAVLASCSPLLSSILRRSKHPHPLIYLWGVKLWQLDAVLDFCYRGQVMVSQGDLGDFIRVATLLGIKGVKGADSVHGEEEKLPHVDMPDKDPDLESIDIKEPMANSPLKTSESTNRGYSNIDQKVEVRPNSLICNFFTIDPSNKAIAKCIKCGKKSQRQKLTSKESVKFSNRGMVSHLRLHKEEYDLWNASRSSLVAKKRKDLLLEENNEVIVQSEPFHMETTLLRSISNVSPIKAFESIKEKSLSALKSEWEEKNEFAIKLENKMENIKNMKSGNQKYKDNIKANRTLKFSCDYPSCSYRSTHSSNLDTKAI